MERTGPQTLEKRLHMACLPSSSKCEWQEIRIFVEHLNETTSSNFVHKRCLDIEIRDSKQPEVLCSDRERELTIERKTFLWPPEYAVNAGVKARIYAAELFGVEGDQMATT